MLTASMLNLGTYEFEVTVTDNQGATATDRVQVTVSPATPSYTALKANIFDAKCGRCHMNGNTSGGYDMDTWAETLTEVVTGQPSMSDLYLRTFDETMPPMNAPEVPLTLQEKADLRLWIERGAPNN
jgi:cytochrome c5